MKAFIEINPKSHRNGRIYILDVNDINEAYKWFGENEAYLQKQSKRRSIENVRCYVKQGYEIIFSLTF